MKFPALTRQQWQMIAALVVALAGALGASSVVDIARGALCGGP